MIITMYFLSRQIVSHGFLDVDKLINKSDFFIHEQKQRLNVLYKQESSVVRPWY